MSRAESFAPLPPDVAARWSKFGKGDRPLFVNLVGLRIDEVRTDYCRMSLPFRPELEQAVGLVHGGAIATLLDAVLVPAVGAAYGREARFATIDLHVQFIAALVQEDAVAEGWIVKRGRSTVFCESEVCSAATGKLVARCSATYQVSV